MLKEDDPVVKRLIFVIRDDLKYTVDMNHTTDIKETKDLITHAANLRRNSFRLIGYHDLKDYTDLDDKKLLELFPETDEVVFKMQVEECEELDLESSEVEVICDKQLFCKIHPLRCSSIFCLTCEKTICAECRDSPAHANHETKEKLEYLNDAKTLVEHAFAGDQNLKVDPKSIVQTEEMILYLKKITEMKYFDKLIDLIREIETKCSNLVHAYNVTAKLSCESLQDNLIQTKRYCVRGLEKLRNEIEMKRILRDEQVFKTFDSKYKQLTKSQSVKIQRDVDNFKILNDTIPEQIISFIEEVYSKTEEFLRGTKSNERFKTLANKIDSFTVYRTNEEDILKELGIDSKSDKSKLFKAYGVRSSTVKKNADDSFNGENQSKSPNRSKKSSQQKNLNSEGEANEGGNKELGFIGKLKQGINLAANMPSQNPAYDKLIKGIKDDVNLPTIELEPISRTQQLPSYTFNPEHFLQTQPNIFNNPIPSQKAENVNVPNPSKQTKMSGKQLMNNGELENANFENLVDQNLSEEEKKIEKINYLKSIGVIFRDKVMAPIAFENSVKVYSSRKDPMTYYVMFPVEECPDYFFNNIAYCHLGDKMYVSGGTDKRNLEQNLCYMVTNQGNNYTVHAIAPLLTLKSNHSMIADDNGYIYAIGGYGSAECERYSPMENTWIALDNLKYERQRAMLAIIKDPNGNSFLYVFFGINKKNEFVKSIERMNLSQPNSKWEEVTYYVDEDDNGESVDLNCYGCGIVHFSEDQILLCGGVKMNPVTQRLQRSNDIVIYQISESRFYDCESNIKKSCAFIENTIYHCDVGYFQLDDTREGLSINISD